MRCLSSGDLKEREELLASFTMMAQSQRICWSELLTFRVQGFHGITSSVIRLAHRR